MEQLTTPVALIFFNRPETLEQVFEKVKKAQPKQLFLIQDGARNEDDARKIKECRKIVEDIDWDCEVHKNYSETNLGCGKRPATGISWVLEQVDRTIILEDDCVPCDTFFAYCEEMLERYKDDDRISYISGLNHFEEWDCGQYSYFFTKTGAIWGWATWRRAWQLYDYNINAINDTYLKKLLPYQFADKETGKKRIASWEYAHTALQEGANLSYWDMQWGLVKYSQNQLVIVPKYNQIYNIGVGAASSHAQRVKSKGFVKYKNFFYIPTRELEFPLSHQQYCACDEEYDKLVYTCTRDNKYIYALKKFIKKIVRK